MILYLLLSILSSTGLLIILKSYTKWKVDTLHGIIFNYWTAASLSFLISPAKNLEQLPELSSIWYIAVLIGLLFILVFRIMGKATQIAGVAATSVASKMSMVIPITAGLLLYNESMNIQKMIGILIAIPAVILASVSSSNNNDSKFNWSTLTLPILLFFGAGLVDTAIKYAQHHFMNENNRQIVIMAIFASAGTLGSFRLIYELVILKKELHLRSIFGGMLLGITNYFSLYFLLKCLEAPGTESSTVFAFVNIGVVITSFFAGMLLFKEKPERNKVIGVLLAVLAIIILSW